MPIRLIPDSNSEDGKPNGFVLKEFNPYHEPAGSGIGGRFAKATGPGQTLTQRRPEFKAIAAEHRVAERLAAQIRAKAQTAAERQHADIMALTEVRNAQQIKEYGGDTFSQHMVTGPDGKARWTAARQQLHEQIVERYFDDLSRKAGHPLSEGLREPTVLVMAGMPGAGKTTAVGKILDTRDAVLADGDALKEYIPEYNKQNAAVVHRESAYLSDLIVEVAYQRRMNLVIDGTMKTPGVLGTGVSDGALGKLEAFKQAGFRTEAILVAVTIEQSVERAVTRFAQDWQQTGVGRYVPPSAIRGEMRGKDGNPKPDATFALVKDTRLPDGRLLVDAWTEYDGWTGRRKPGGRGTHRMTI